MRKLISLSMVVILLLSSISSNLQLVFANELINDIESLNMVDEVLVDETEEMPMEAIEEILAEEDSNNNVIADVDYTVTFKDYDGTTLKTETVVESNDATAPLTPARSDYVFSGWDTVYTNVQSDLVVTAQYKRDYNNNGVIDKYTVVFIGWKDKEVDTQIVLEGDDAREPYIKKHYESKGKEYDFAGWNKEFTNIQSDLTVKAIFKRDKEASTSGVYNSTELANSIKYMEGMPDGTFMPEKELTRAELVVLLDRFYGLDQKYEVSDDYNKFTDVDVTKWYGDAVNRMAQEGIVKGYEDGSFKPEKTITREELAQIIYNKMHIGCCYEREVKESYFGNIYSDIYNLWSTDALISLQIRGLLQDFQGSDFNPESAISRGETALLLNRYFGYELSDNNNISKEFSDVELNSKWSVAVALASNNNMVHSKFISDLEKEMH